MTDDRDPLLDVRDLTVEFADPARHRQGGRSMSMSRVAKGETLGIVGESGSGKSVTSYAVMRILDRAGRIADGAIMFSGIDRARMPAKDEMRDLRGREISMIFQNPRAGAQSDPQGRPRRSRTCCCSTSGRSPATSPRRRSKSLEQVRIARPRERYHAYPFELSGGMCQRIVIALALACQPQLLIADEPTTGLDVTTQKTVMELVVELTRERGMSTILITHDLGLAATLLRPGRGDGKGQAWSRPRTSSTIFTAPRTSYTRKLMRATPRPGMSLRDLLPEEAPPRGADPSPSCASAERTPLLVVEKLVKEYPRKGTRARRRAKSSSQQADARTRGRSARSTASTSRSRAARAWAWSANPAAASPRPR